MNESVGYVNTDADVRIDAQRTGIGLGDPERRAVVATLNTVLADEFVLYAKTRRFHWNVEGPDFAALHALFEKQYRELSDIIDDVAERARALDGMAAGSLEEYLELTRLGEGVGERYSAAGMIGALLADHERIIRNLRIELEVCMDDYGDQGTMDFLIGLMQVHEKMAWILRAHLKDRPAAV
jgi:starvation-inducible DNA-binding protein